MPEIGRAATPLELEVQPGLHAAAWDEQRAAAPRLHAALAHRACLRDGARLGIVIHALAELEAA
eukprot:2281574-Alexandrium_andersonii.AAC.1